MPGQHQPCQTGLGLHCEPAARVGCLARLFPASAQMDSGRQQGSLEQSYPCSFECRRRWSLAGRRLGHHLWRRGCRPRARWRCRRNSYPRPGRRLEEAIRHGERCSVVLRRPDLVLALALALGSTFPAERAAGRPREHASLSWTRWRLLSGYCVIFKLKRRRWALRGPLLAAVLKAVPVVAVLRATERRKGLPDMTRQRDAGRARAVS